MNNNFDWEAQHRRTLLDGHAALERTAESVARSHTIAAETEQIGTEVVTELGGQRETLLRAKGRLTQTDDELDRSRKIVRVMTRRVLTNKFILILIILLEITILSIVVYMKFFHKK